MKMIARPEATIPGMFVMGPATSAIGVVVLVGFSDLATATALQLLVLANTQRAPSSGERRWVVSFVHYEGWRRTNVADEREERIDRLGEDFEASRQSRPTTATTAAPRSPLAIAVDLGE